MPASAGPLFRAFFLVTAGGVFVESFLLLLGFGMGDAGPMSLRQGVESFHAAAFVEPFLLAGGSTPLRGSDYFPGLGNGRIEPVKEGAVVVPGVAANAALGRGQKTALVLVPVLHQEFKPLCRLLLA